MCPGLGMGSQGSTLAPGGGRRGEGGEGGKEREVGEGMKGRRGSSGDGEKESEGGREGLSRKMEQGIEKWRESTLSQ